ncbi:MAG TPA: CotH kinase family protein [Planococcus sp. (in: firmicutes)]|nr:CotH kinase family protein [Planococcus sp. (in: firmicutes)]
MKFIVPVLLIASLAFFWSFMYFFAEEPASVEPAFANALETELGITGGFIDANQVKDITELDLSNYQLTDISGIEKFHSLESLDVSHNLLTSAEEISTLNNLRIVNLSFNQISELDFSSTGLKELDIEGNKVADLSFLEDMSQLEKLTIRDNKIEELNPLKSVSALTHLNARGNRIQSIEAIGELHNLRDLNLRNNQVVDISPLQSLTSLNERLYLSGNGIKDFTALSESFSTIYEVDFDLLLPPPEFTLEGGVIELGAELALTSTTEDANIYYTTDGSMPSPGSQLYTGPIMLNEELLEANPVLSNYPTSTTRVPFNFTQETVKDGIVIRAVAFKNRETSEAITNTYFVNERTDFSSELPVMAISTEEDSFFGENEGIYVPGIYAGTSEERLEGNYFQRGGDWERKAHVEFFSEDGTREFAQDIGIRIHGGLSRALPQKSLRLYSKSEYGQSRFYYPFFEGNQEIEYNRLLLRNSGNDWNTTMLRDGFIQTLVENRVVDTQDYQPVIVMLNGEYWGIHNLRERYDSGYLEVKYNLNEEDIVILESDTGGGSGFEIDHGQLGDLNQYNELIDFVQTQNLEMQEHIDHVETQMDVENYLNYIAYQIFIGNKDSLTNNTSLWRKNVDYNPEAPYGHDGRWRWLLFDTDFGLAMYGDLEEVINDNTLEWFLREHPSTELFRGLMANEETKEQFISIMSELISNEFSYSNTSAVLEKTAGAIEREMPRHLERWQTLNSLESWNNEIARIEQFLEKRPEIVRRHLSGNFDLTATE